MKHNLTRTFFYLARVENSQCDEIANRRVSLLPTRYPRTSWHTLWDEFTHFAQGAQFCLCWIRRCCCSLSAIVNAFTAQSYRRWRSQFRLICISRDQFISFWFNSLVSLLTFFPFLSLSLSLSLFPFFLFCYCFCFCISIWFDFLNRLVFEAPFFRFCFYSLI